MLAQSFKSAKELNITDQQRQALIATLVLLETGKVMDISSEELDNLNHQDRQIDGFIFNMEHWAKDYDCGTVRCIGGTAEALVGAAGLFSLSSNSDLEDLFYPPCSLDWSVINLPIAAKALRNYLTTGKPNWAGAMA